MLNRNYTRGPVFFGCDTELTTSKDTRSPLLLYMANSPYSAYTNYSYAQMATTKVQLDEVMVNSFDIVTQANGTLDEEWPECIGCAAIERSRGKLGLPRTAQCEGMSASALTEEEQHLYPPSSLPLAMI